MKLRVYRILALTGVFTLMALILLNTVWLSPPEQFPAAVILLLLLGPLLFPLRGLLAGRRRTHLWASLLATPYILVGASLAATGSHQSYGLLMILCSLCFFAGCLGYARSR